MRTTPESNDSLVTATPTANGIPIADDMGSLAPWINGKELDLSKLNVGSPRTTTARTNIETNDPNTVGLTVRAHSSGVLPDPSSITGLTLWVEADSLAQTLSNGDPISALTDKSANAYVFSQTGVNRPTFQTNVINSLPTIRFYYGSSQSLSATVTRANIYANPMTTFVLVKETGVYSDNALFYDIDTKIGVYGQAFGNNMIYDAGSNVSTAGRLTIPSITSMSGNWVLVSTKRTDSQAQSILLNNAVIGGPVTELGSGPTLSGTSTLSIGTDNSGSVLDADIALVIVYNRSLTTDEYNTVYDWIAAKYGQLDHNGNPITFGGTAQSADLVDMLNDSGETIAKIDATGKITGTGFDAGSQKITSLKDGSSPSDAATFGQIPTALPPSGAAGGDLSGNYPSPTWSLSADRSANNHKLTGLAAGTTNGDSVRYEQLLINEPLRFNISGNGAVIQTGVSGYYRVPFTGTITQWYADANASGSTSIDIKRSGTSIVGAGNKPALATAQNANAAPSGWTSVAVTAGDMLQVVTEATTTITDLFVMLTIQRTA